MKIKISSRSTIGDTATVSNSVLAVLKQANLDDAFIQLQLQKLEDNHTKLSNSYKELGAKNSLLPKDEARDNALRVLFYEAKSKSLWPQANVKNAAIQLLETLDNYGLEIIQYPYHIESANINGLIADLKTPVMQAVIAKLDGVNMLVDQLITTQADFETAYLDYVSQKVDNKETLPAYRLSELIQAQINQELLVYLEGMIQADPTKFINTYQLIVTIVQDHNSKVKNRNKQASKLQTNEVN